VREGEGETYRLLYGKGSEEETAAPHHTTHTGTTIGTGRDVRHTDTQRSGGRGGRETYSLSRERVRKRDSHTTRRDRHRNNDRDRHRTRRDETGNGDAWRWRWDERGRSKAHRQTDRHTDDRGVAAQERGRRGGRETYSLSHERGSEEETATQYNDRDRHRTRRDMTGNGDAWRWEERGQ
jgi:hypothetical protein